jgi:hypothetical protein
MKEFVCPDGTMSVDGVCRMFMTAEERESLKFSPQKSFDQKYESIEDIPITQGTTPKTDLFTGVPKTDTSLKSPGIIDTKSFLDQYKSKEISSSRIDRVIDIVNTTLSPMVDSVTQPVKDMVSKVPKGFDFDFEKVKETKQTADNIITANTNYYNDYVENKLGIPTGIQEGLRVASSLYGLAQGGGVAAAAGPFAIPVILGGAIKSADNRRIQNITMQDTQGALPQVTSPRIMNIQPTAQDIYRGGGGDRPSPSPTRTSQGVTSAQYQAFRL